jgi:MFS family permease
MHQSESAEGTGKAASGLPQSETRVGNPWVMLAVLTAIFILANLDRNILSIMLPDIQREFALRDWQLGLLGGFAFSLVYGVVGIFISDFADRGNRPRIIAWSLFIWSAMTMACGSAANFVQLLLARGGVGLGEGGCSPPAHALIAHRIPEHRRSLALGIYAAGATIGLTASYLLGAFLVSEIGWRKTMFVVGLPGLLLAPFVTGLIGRDPARAGEPGGPASRPLLIRVISNFRPVLASPTMRNLLLAASLAAGVSASTILFVPTYLMRVHGMSQLSVGLALGLYSGIVGSAGIVIGGWIADRLGRRSPELGLWVPVLCKLLSLPALALFFMAGDAETALWAYALPVLLGGVWLGPTYAAVQACAAPDQRATYAAILLLIYNILGFGLVPFGLGIVSDMLKESFGKQSIAGALLLLVPISVWSSFHFYRAMRAFRRSGAGFA